MRKSGNAADRRPVVLELAPEGRALMARLGRIAQAFRAKLLAGLGRRPASWTGSCRGWPARKPARPSL
ncbi:hypothetical protein ACDP63_09695 [Paracoccus sp. P2]|uniref:Winged helix-turn-helix transcriptional regulator n=1 Tax=Paracoccus pantotrophus TaxID=82367 RepID=A0A7H9BP31_PARPN|nr:MarR family winged helix-turn-helix transcriptional regulator [Paracoccus pantotrophus]MDF3855342.1 MarR family winged helix-turn-helix transcriptional regulator [Paracoccus pantotrophus]QLH12753.1 winged helix-turn-helix transcriptional regulator [Paracoccus pantotrophus]